MKVYLVKRKKTNVRWFDNDQDLTDFLINAPEKISEYQVITLNADIESEMTGDVILNAITEQVQLDTKLSVVLGDDYSAKVQKMIKMYEQLCNKAPWDNTKMTQTALKVYEKLTTTAPVEKLFKKIPISNLRYLLYCVSNSVEWYKALCDLYAQIRTKSLEETCEFEYVDSVTRGTSWRGQRTPVIMVKNFEKAKKEG